MNSVTSQRVALLNHNSRPIDHSFKTNYKWLNQLLTLPNDQDRKFKILILIFVLVFLLHYCVLICLQRQVNKTNPARPLPMEVSIIQVKTPKLSIAPPPHPAVEKRPIPKKPQSKPTLKKIPIDAQKPSDFAPTKQIFEPESFKTIAPLPATIESESTTTKIKSFIQADISASYAHNPIPDYPIIAKIRGWQGEVLLRVKVSEQGISDLVEVQRSSGYDVLDESAIEAVQQWLFTPAKYGDEPIASSVIVPIVFSLNDQKQV